MKKERKIAVCLPAYKRFSDLQRQIYCMMSQSYANMHLFVAIKGMTEYVFHKILLKQFANFIKEGRLTLRLFPNKNQLSNIIDATRGLDVSEYDLFAKIDDDDFYSPDYIRTINDFHNTIPSGYSSFFEDTHWVRYENEGFTCLGQAYYSAFGANLVLSRKAMEVVIECDSHPDNIAELVPEAGHNGYGFTEDNLIRMIMQQTGCKNRAEFIHEKAIEYHMIYERGNTSVMRGGIISGQFAAANSSITQDPECYEHVIELKHPQWGDLLCLQGAKGHRVGLPQETAIILLFTEKELILKWTHWGQERFLKSEESVYVRDDSFTGYDNMMLKEKKGRMLLKIEHPQWQDYLLIDGTRIKRLEAYDEGEIMDFSDEAFTILWTRWGKEKFIKMENGCYTLDETP